MMNKSVLVLFNYFVVFVFISFAVDNTLALETLMTSLSISAFVLAGGAFFTFIANLSNGLSFKKELWIAWFDNAKIYSVVAGLIVLNLLFIVHIADKYFID
tara:strand:+ start:219 stop:521 length:303 start_codon:yes stop_codon:yes gene_type:complete